MAENTDVLIAALRSALREALSSGVGRADVKREYSLPWSELQAVFAERLDSIAQLSPASVVTDARARTALDLAKKYLSGWRPDSESRLREPESEEDKAVTLLRSGVQQQRLVAYARLQQVVAPGSADRAERRRSLAEGTMLTLDRIAKDQRYSLDERSRVIAIMRHGGLTPSMRKDLARMWLTDGTVDAQLSGALGLMWDEDASRLGELLDVIEATVPVGPNRKRVVTDRARDAFSAVKLLIEGHAADIPEPVVRRTVELLRSFAPDDRLRGITRELATAIGPDVS